MKNNSKMIWDSAGDQNATEYTWLLEEAQRRGLKVTYVHVNADPKQRWADPQIGAVSRANDPLDGRMVDAKVYADSYAIGNANQQAFYEQHKNNPNVNFVFMDAAVPNPKFDKSKPADLKTNPQYLAPQRRDTMPESALGYDARKLAAFALKTVRSRKDIPPHIARGATMGSRIWKGERPTNGCCAIS